MLVETLFGSVEATQACTTCGEVKPIDRFASEGDGKRRKTCKDCRAAYMRRYLKSNPEQRAKALKRAAARHERLPRERKNIKLRLVYGMTLDDYESLVAAQGNLCAICGKPESAIDKRTGTARALAVDHHHGTNKVRGLLCAHCNRALGLVKENPVTLASMIAYLTRHATA